MEIIKIKIDDLKPYKNNAKLHPEWQIEQIIKSIEQFGFNDPIAIWGEDNIIVEGHGRLEAVKKLGYTEVECIRLDHLTEEERKAYTLAHNKTTMNSDFDFDLLKLELDDIKGIDMSDFGFELDLDEDDEEVVEDDYEAVLPTEPKAKLGDIYQLGNHRLMCGDSTSEEDVSKLMNGKKADMVFTDPPFPNNSGIMHDMIKNIDIAFCNARKNCNGIQMWFWDNLCFPPFEEMVTSKHIWHKTNGWQTNHFEEIYCFHNDGRRHEQLVFSKNNIGGDMKRENIGNHPTPKPTGLFIEIVKTLNIDFNIVLDLFGGSGSTLIACEQLNRNCYMMELDCKYIQVIIERYIAFTGNKVYRLNDDGTKTDWEDIK